MQNNERHMMVMKMKKKRWRVRRNKTFTTGVLNPKP